VVADAGPGHVVPAIALCVKFAEAGDEPTLFTGDSWLDVAAGAGIAARHVTGQPARQLDWDLGRMLHGWAAEVAPLLAPRIAATKPDLVVCDIFARGGWLAAELLDVPWAQLSPHPLYEPSKGLPPMGSGLAVGVGLTGRLRDSVLRAATARAIRTGHRQWADTRQRIGLAARDRGPTLRLVATLPALEVPRPDWPDNAHVVGPLVWELSRDIMSRPPGEGPLVVIAPSTAISGAVGMAGIALDALDGLGVRVVVSTMDPAPAALPDWVRWGVGRQDELLRAASAVVCGGGHGMLAKALLAGTPAVIAPGGGDQWELANRAARQGSAVIARPLDADTLRAAVARVLDDPRFAASAVAAGATVADTLDPVCVCREAIEGPTQHRPGSGHQHA
jgi:UDP:flavonoid glycosyltransferase YjiC (YdhE family)